MITERSLRWFWHRSKDKMKEQLKGSLLLLLGTAIWGCAFVAQSVAMDYYPDIRPLKKAVFQYAVKFDKPVIPITLSYRPRTGIFKLFGKKPLVDLHIGEPLYADKSLSKREAAEKMRAEAYHIMQVMNGINPGDPTYNTDQNPDNYKKTM